LGLTGAQAVEKEAPRSHIGVVRVNLSAIRAALAAAHEVH
jgi:predicted benzoate:H+ symporter BenE